MDLKIAVACSSNQNRSMEAHSFLRYYFYVKQKFVMPRKSDRRLASAWIHCAGSATYQVTDPEP